ncbi:hypothetical protein C0Q70_20076 [Pomacea canaliculata]|uniref:Tetraspanin n=1 Tax=Pomacea canaliculata TaxID=400727 RepID=A0A2T7NEJ4_POMCA|nr:tetraspanin-3-like [Pomacea canaliculata]PVD19586.1 hypothetical protein C0Q70_20076 [Pomacea canaliculata]
MGACTTTTKIFLMIISFVFWGAAVALCFISAWVFKTYNDFGHLTESTLILLPASIVLGIGIFMFIVGLLGFIAVCKEHKLLLSIFFCLILVIFLGEVVAGSLGYVYRKDVEKTVSDGLTDALKNYNDTNKAGQIDYLQKELHCCGVHNASDWTMYPFSKMAVPTSCCNLTQVYNTTTCNTQIGSKDIYNEGCLDVLEHKFIVNLIYIASTTISFAVIQILGLISACILICRTHEVKYDRLENAQRNGLRV